MRHRKHGKKFNRDKAHRKALLRNLILALLKYESIKTTLAKAKEVSRLTEKTITFSKQGTLSARREVAKLINDKKLLGKIFNELGPRFKDRKGGYTRIYRINSRKGDNSSMVLLELVIKTEKEKPKKKRIKAEKAKPVEKEKLKEKEKKISEEEKMAAEREKEKKEKEKEREEERKRAEKKRKFPGFTRIFRRKSFGQRPEK